MSWRKTILTQKDIKWKQPKIKQTKDGKVDLNIKIPLTDILCLQAKNSYLAGASKAINWLADKQLENKLITEGDLEKLFSEMELNDIWVLVREKNRK